jgi:osmotically-inducible protein OsmY
MTDIKHVITGCVAALTVALAAGCASTSRQDSTGEYVADKVLTAQVKAALVNEPTLQSNEIKVETYRGVVRLSGFVSSTAAENTAVALARAVPGVKSVKYDTRLK